MSIKEKCDNYLNTRVYNYTKSKKRKKAILRKISKKKFEKNFNILNFI